MSSPSHHNLLLDAFDHSDVEVPKLTCKIIGEPGYLEGLLLQSSVHSIACMGQGIMSRVSTALHREGHSLVGWGAAV